MFCLMHVARKFKTLGASAWRQILLAVTAPPGRVRTPMFPEIDTSFLGDAGPLPTTVGPHWPQYIGKTLLVSEVYYDRSMVKRHTGPVILVSVDARKGTLCLQRVIRKAGTTLGPPTEKVGPTYHIAGQDCRFITVVSDKK